MSQEKISRRDFTVKAAGVAAGLAAAPLLMAQTKTEPPKPPVTDAEIDAVQKQLAKPLSDEAKKILRDDLVTQKQNTAKRLAVKLTDTSEPCFTFIPTPKAEQAG